MKVRLGFLKPRLSNILITIVIFSLPFLRERAVLPEGGYEVAYYRPIFLLVSYLQMQEWQSFFLMFGFSLVIYLIVSLVIAVVTPLWKKISKWI